jgi:hypothetical protein
MFWFRIKLIISCLVSTLFPILYPFYIFFNFYDFADFCLLGYMLCGLMKINDVSEEHVASIFRAEE